MKSRDRVPLTKAVIKKKTDTSTLPFQHETDTDFDSRKYSERIYHQKIQEIRSPISHKRGKYEGIQNLTAMVGSHSGIRVKALNMGIHGESSKIFKNPKKKVLTRKYPYPQNSESSKIKMAVRISKGVRPSVISTPTQSDRTDTAVNEIKGTSIRQSGVLQKIRKETDVHQRDHTVKMKKSGKLKKKLNKIKKIGTSTEIKKYRYKNGDRIHKDSNIYSNISSQSLFKDDIHSKHIGPVDAISTIMDVSIPVEIPQIKRLSTIFKEELKPKINLKPRKIFKSKPKLNNRSAKLENTKPKFILVSKPRRKQRNRKKVIKKDKLSNNIINVKEVILKTKAINYDPTVEEKIPKMSENPSKKTKVLKKVLRPHPVKASDDYRLNKVMPPGTLTTGDPGKFDIDMGKKNIIEGLRIKKRKTHENSKNLSMHSKKQYSRGKKRKGPTHIMQDDLSLPSYHGPSTKNAVVDSRNNLNIERRQQFYPIVQRAWQIKNDQFVYLPIPVRK